MGQVAFAISSVPEVPVIQLFDIKQHSMKKAQEKSLGTLQLIMMRLSMLSSLELEECRIFKNSFSRYHSRDHPPSGPSLSGAVAGQVATAQATAAQATAAQATAAQALAPFPQFLKPV